jgi:thiol-disulfide isomerase/thioredoxin
MNKGVFFALGIVLAGVGTAGYQALKVDPQPIEVKKKEPTKVSLLTINYIPSTPTVPLENIAYWEKGEKGEVVEKNLKDLQGKPVILHFWATWCGPCVKELPDLDAFAGKQKAAHIVAIATDLKDAEKIRNFYQSKGITNLTIAFDKSGSLHRSLNTTGLPTTIFINSQGHEIGRIQGIIEWTGKAGRLLKAHLTKN